MRTGGIIQARLGSTRLPNKVLLPLPCGAKTSTLDQIIRRAGKASSLDEVVVATSYNKNDDEVEALCRTLNVKCFRGDEYNVLSRYFHAAKAYGLDIIVRLTGDNPCIDYNLLDSAVRHHLDRDNDYTLTRYYPAGMNIEVLSFQALRSAFDEARADHEREHVTPYIAADPGRYKNSFIDAEGEYRCPDIRVTLDTEEDYALLCVVFDILYPHDNFFGAKELIRLFREKPWLYLINKKIVQKEIFDTLEEELREAAKICDLQDLKKAKKFLESQIN